MGEFQLEPSVRALNLSIPEQEQVENLIRSAANIASAYGGAKLDFRAVRALKTNWRKKGPTIWLVKLPPKEKALVELDEILPRLISCHEASLVTLVTPETVELLEFQRRFRESPLGHRWHVLLTDRRGEARHQWVEPFTEIFREMASEQTSSEEHRVAQEPTAAYATVEQRGKAIGVQSRLREHQEGKRLHYWGVADHLRSEKGRLDAKRIAHFFGLSLRELATALEERPQTVDKTPDSKRLQEKLHPYEEIARAQVFLGSDEGRFRKWLNTPSRDLVKAEGKNLAPIDLIKRGRPEVVAGLVDDALTGVPG